MVTDSCTCIAPGQKLFITLHNSSFEEFDVSDALYTGLVTIMSEPISWAKAGPGQPFGLLEVWPLRIWGGQPSLLARDYGISGCAFCQRRNGLSRSSYQSSSFCRLRRSSGIFRTISPRAF